jgi:K+-transporting ATPase ATPase C chain
MKSIFRSALVMFAALTLVCCVMYPLAVTGIGQVVFPWQAAGSLILRDNKPIGSMLIGQAFSSPKYFWGRPSATSPMPNNATGSTGSNLGPTNPAQIDAVKGRIDALKSADMDNTARIPIDLVTASASGLDPEISLAAAQYQAGRIARTRKITVAQVRQLIEENSTNGFLGVFGEPRVNVLILNLALDKM